MFRTVVQMQMAGDGVAAPPLDLIQAADLCPRRGEIMSFPPTSPHAKQVVPNHRLASSPADEIAEQARPSWPPRAAGRRRRHPHACQNRRRAAHSWATVMRHFLPLTLPVRLLTAGVLATPPRSLLVPLTGASQAVATSLIDNARSSSDDRSHTTSRCRPRCGIGRRRNGDSPGGNASTRPSRAWTWTPTGGNLTPLGPCSSPPVAGDSCLGYAPPPVSPPILPPYTALPLAAPTRATMMLRTDPPQKARLNRQCAALFNRR